MERDISRRELEICEILDQRGERRRGHWEGQYNLCTNGRNTMNERHNTHDT